MIHDDVGVTLMVFGLVTFAKIKLHPPSSIREKCYNSKCYPPSYDTLDFCEWGGQIRKI